MLRNIAKMKNEGAQIIAENDRYSLSISELAEIKDIYHLSAKHIDGVFDVITTAYLVGLASGCRYGTKKERKKYLPITANFK